MPSLLPLPEKSFIGSFIKREKRFFIHFMHKGEKLTAHTNNSGSMMGLLREGVPILLSTSDNPDRKLPYTLEMLYNHTLLQRARNLKTYGEGGASLENLGDFQDVEASQLPDDGWIGVNTMVPNKLLRAAFDAGALPFAHGYTSFKPEAKHGGSRLDALLTGEGLPPLYVECKNVTLVEDGVAAFPDAVTERGQKHLGEMAAILESGCRAAFFYCIQRQDASCFAPADYIDPKYAALFYATLAKGVEAYPFVVSATPSGFSLGKLLPVLPE